MRSVMAVRQMGIRALCAYRQEQSRYQSPSANARPVQVARPDMRRTAKLPRNLQRRGVDTSLEHMARGAMLGFY